MKGVIHVVNQFCIKLQKMAVLQQRFLHGSGITFEDCTLKSIGFKRV